MVFLTRCCFKVDSMLCKQSKRWIVHRISNAKGSRSGHFAVGEKVKFHAMFRHRLTEFGWLIRRDTQDLKSIIVNLGFDGAQLTQLPIAVWSPATAVKH